MRALFPMSILAAFLVGCAEDPMPQQEWTVDCTGAASFSLGMTTTSPAGLTVALMTAEPAPVDVGDNQWSLMITDAAGQPVTGLSPMIRPFMPLHGHGVSPERYAGTEGADGTYSFESFDVIMPGLWDFHVELSPTDEALFSLCAEG